MPHAGKTKLAKAVTSISLGCVVWVSADSHCHGNSYVVSALSVLTKKECPRAHAKEADSEMADAAT